VRDDLPPEEPIAWYLASDGHHYGPLTDPEMTNSGNLATCVQATFSGEKGLRIGCPLVRCLIWRRKREGGWKFLLKDVAAVRIARRKLRVEGGCDCCGLPLGEIQALNVVFEIRGKFGKTNAVILHK
jgi:hypothetical protein